MVVGSVVLLVTLVLLGRALLVVLSIGPRADYWQEQAQEPGDVAYVALGDSLTQGIGSSSPDAAFVSVLADDLAERTGKEVRVVNLSVTGATTEELVEDQLPELEQVLVDLESDGVELGLVTLAIGSNDVGDVTVQEYREDLTVALDALPDGSYVADVPDFNGGPSLQDAAELSRVVREEVAAREDLVLVPLEEYTAELSLTEYAADYFHPSDSGYERYVAAFRSVIGPGDRR